MISGDQTKRSEFENSPDASRRHTRRSRLIVFAVSISIITFAILANNPYRNLGTTIPTLNPEVFLPAISAYREDCSKRGEPILNEVSLTQLTRWGYLEKTKIEADEVDEIYFTTNLKYPLLPQSILCRTEFLDGTQIVVLGDGSVQSFSAERFRSFTRDTEMTKSPQ